MTIKQFFKGGIFAYANSAENFVRCNYPQQMHYTFVSDLAIADWFGMKEVKQTIKQVLSEWGTDYEALTEFIVSVNWMAWFHDALSSNGVEGREEFIKFYSEEYYRLRDEFYKRFKDNEEAKKHFFEMTD